MVEVVPGSPAERAGIRPGDLVVEVDGEPTESAADLQRMMVAELIGRPVTATVWRSGEEIALRLVPDELDDGRR